MKKLLSLIVFALILSFSLSASAQVKDYTFSQSSGTYTPITGGTIVATATGASGAASLDDIIYNLPAATIPFTFTYDGTGYTGLNISTNGFITLGATAPGATNYTPISNTATYSGAISPFGGDLNSLFNILGNTGEIRYETVGSSPNREFVIQYSNFRPFSTSTSTTLFWRWNFQIRLHENNSVSFVYDANFVGAVTATTRQVGLRGPNNTFATNVDNRLITTGTHTWSTSVEGTANTSLCGASTTNIPVSGQTFTWTPPLPAVANDMGVSAVTIGSSPVQIITAGKGYNLTATAKNFGTNTQNVVPVYYTVNGGSPIGPVNTVGPIATNATENVLFSGGFAFTPLTPGLYVVKAYTALAGDGNVVNDTFTVNVNVLAKLTAFPYLQTFTNPVNWTIVIENLVGTTGVWGLGICVNPDGKVGDTAATANFFNASALRREVLRSPEMDFTGLTNPVLSFYTAYRTFTGGEDDSLEVVVSTDGGVNFFSATTAYNKSDASLPSLATRPGQSAAYFPDSSGQWRHETVQLTNVANSANVVIGFRGKSDFGNRLWIDNVIVSNPDRTCSNIVTATGSYQCDSLLRLNFNTLPLPPKGQNFFADGSAIKEKAEDYNVGNIPAVDGNVSVVSAPNTDNPGGGDAFVSTYLNNDPGQNIEVNTTATTQSGGIFTPSSAYHDYWYRVTYTGNDKTGFANYDLFVYLDGLVFLDPTNLYIMKRTDPTGNWVCLNTTLVGNYLVATGLNDFSDFAIGGSEPLPVELSSFVSVISGNNVTLNWSTSTETNNAGFDIERSAVNGSWSKIGSVSGNGTSNTPHSYSFTDRAVASGKYNYRLKQTDFNGNFEYHNLGSEVIIGVPVKFDLAQNYPNPFNPSTKINYDLPADGKVAIRLFDMSGKEVALLVNEVKTAGYHTVNFNASNLSSGVYFYSISVEANGNNFTATKKMMLVK